MDYQQPVTPYAERALDRQKLWFMGILFIVLLLGALFWHLL